MATRTHDPTTEELTKSIDVALAANPNAGWKDVHIAVMKRNETWRVPERRVAKFVKRYKSGEGGDDESAATSQSNDTFARRFFKQQSATKFSRKRIATRPTSSSLRVAAREGRDDDDMSYTSKGSIRKFFSKDKSARSSAIKKNVSKEAPKGREPVKKEGPLEKAPARTSAVNREVNKVPSVDRSQDDDDVSVSSRGSIRKMFRGRKNREASKKSSKAASKVLKKDEDEKKDEEDPTSEPSDPESLLPPMKGGQEVEEDEATNFIESISATNSAASDAEKSKTSADGGEKGDAAPTTKDSVPREPQPAAQADAPIEEHATADKGDKQQPDLELDPSNDVLLQLTKSDSEDNVFEQANRDVVVIEEAHVVEVSVAEETESKPDEQESRDNSEREVSKPEAAQSAEDLAHAVTENEVHDADVATEEVVTSDDAPQVGPIGEINEVSVSKEQEDASENPVEALNVSTAVGETEAETQAQFNESSPQEDTVFGETDNGPLVQKDSPAEAKPLLPEEPTSNPQSNGSSDTTFPSPVESDEKPKGDSGVEEATDVEGSSDASLDTDMKKPKSERVEEVDEKKRDEDAESTSAESEASSDEQPKSRAVKVSFSDVTQVEEVSIADDNTTDGEEATKVAEKSAEVIPSNSSIVDKDSVYTDENNGNPEASVCEGCVIL